MDDDADMVEGAQRWERGLDRSWEGMSFSGEGGFHFASRSSMKKPTVNSLAKVRRGLFRAIMLVVDLSRAMELSDLRPNRLKVATAAIARFITDFYAQNPVGQIGLIVLKNGVAELLNEPGCSPAENISALKRAVQPSGAPSLCNGLAMAKTCLSHVPLHAKKEIILVYSALFTCDPPHTNIHNMIAELKKAEIRVSVVGLAAEIAVLTELASKTGGLYEVCLDEGHLRDIFMGHTAPPPLLANETVSASFIPMGFPEKKHEQTQSYCLCHVNKLSFEGYICPRCGGKHCELPTPCMRCGLTLIMASHLARSYHHLFPLPEFVPEPESTALAARPVCYSCSMAIPRYEDASPMRCSGCRSLLCLECYTFVTDSLHSCPGCESTRAPPI